MSPTGPALERLNMHADGDPPAAAAQSQLRPQTWITYAVVLLLTIHGALLCCGACVHSPTYNEPAHLVAGISYWHFGRFDAYSVNPPFVRMIAAVPVLFAGYQADWHNFRTGPGDRFETALASDFCSANGERTIWLVTLARLACIPFGLLGGYICFRWASDLYGFRAGLLSLTLWAICPNILSHGHLITCDAAATALCVAACYQFWYWLKSPTWWNAILSGLVLGVAELTKTTLLILYPLWPVLWLVYRRSDRPHLSAVNWLRESGMLCTGLVLGLYVINAGYGFEGSFTRLNEFQFVSHSLSGNDGNGTSSVNGNRFANSWLGQIPIPLPRQYVVGIDLQRKDFESYNSEFYLGGRWSVHGWWYYYLYALAIKVPLGTWILLLIALAVRLWSGLRIPLRDEVILLAPAVVILVLVSSQTGMNEHIRYVLPIFPFVFIWLGRVSAGLVMTPTSTHAGTIRKVISYLALLAVSWSTLSSLWAFPHTLSYFNELAGGRKNGWKYLANSNIDWGQDLLFLKRWARTHPEAHPLRLALFGTIDQKLLGIEAEVYSEWRSAAELPPGYYAVSATILAGFRQTDHGRRWQMEIERSQYAEIVGGSIFVFQKH